MAQLTNNPFAGTWTSWKTTVPALAMAVIDTLQGFGVTHMSIEQVVLVNGLLMAIIGIFARDANKSSEGATVKPTEPPPPLVNEPATADTAKPKRAF